MNRGLKSRTLRRRWTTGLACLAILLASFMPVLSHAWAKSPLPSAAQLKLMDRLAQEQTCHGGEAGPAIASVATGEAPGQGHDPQHLMEHCPFCLAHGASHGPPPCAQKTLPLAESAPEWLPGRSPILPAQNPPWRLAVSRAPPALL